MTRARNDEKIFAILTPEQRVQAGEAKMLGSEHGFNHGEVIVVSLTKQAL